MNQAENDWSSIFWNVRPILVEATRGPETSLQEYLHQTFRDEQVDAIVDQQMYGTWQRDYRHDFLSLRVSSLSCVQNLNTIGMWSRTETGEMRQIDLISGKIHPGASIRIYWFDEDTILVKPESKDHARAEINIGRHQGIHSQSFGLFVRSTNGSCSFTLDCWNGEGIRMLAFQNPRRANQWIITCNLDQHQPPDHSFSHSILELTGMLPERRMLAPSVARYLDYQRELVW